MTSISATSGSSLPVAPAAAAGRTAVGSELRRHQFVRSERAVVRADRHQLLAAGRQRGRFDGGGTKFTLPATCKSKIDNLIAGEVSSGKLTSAQATELQGVFQAAFAGGPANSSGAGAPPATAGCRCGGPVGAASGRRTGRRAWRPSRPSWRPSAVRPRPTVHPSTGSTGSSSDTSSADDILQQFLQSLQDSLSSSSQNSYSATGSCSRQQAVRPSRRF